MNCPKCGKPMEEGVLSSASPVFWSIQVTGLPLPTQKGDVLLGKALGLLRPKACLCRACRKVVVHYCTAARGRAQRAPTKRYNKLRSNKQ